MANEIEVLKVSSQTKAVSLGGAITGVAKQHMNEKGTFLELTAVGASAVNVAVKSVIIANGWLAPLGRILYVVPAFYDVDLEVNGTIEKRTSIRLRLSFANI